MGKSTIILLAALSPASAIRLTRGRLLAGLGGCVAAAPLACEAYARAPPTWRASELPGLAVDESAEEIVVVLPGAGGPDANTES